MSRDRLLLAAKARRGHVPEAGLVDGKMVETALPSHRLQLSTMCKAADVLWLLWLVDSDAAVLPGQLAGLVRAVVCTVGTRLLLLCC